MVLHHFGSILLSRASPDSRARGSKIRLFRCVAQGVVWMQGAGRFGAIHASVYQPGSVSGAGQTSVTKQTHASALGGLTLNGSDDSDDGDQGTP